MAALTNRDIVELTEWRQHLHRHPELSGFEVWTASEVAKALSETAPDDVLTGLGGHGVAAIYSSGAPGPTVLLRCELDALPITEIGDLSYKSTRSGNGHLCGHDGHMAIMAGVARLLGRNRPTTGLVILLFQPAEEDGSGAKRIIEDPAFAALKPDFALSLHNYPGLALGHARLAAGAMNCASRGLKIALKGRTAHASEPEKAISPSLAVAGLLNDLTALKRGTHTHDPDFALSTITHVNLGTAAFGITPGDAEIWVTLRTQRDATMDALVAQAEALVADQAKTHGLQSSLSYHDVFRHCMNDPEATNLLIAALDAEGIAHDDNDLPMRASEDFGRFGDVSKSAMFLLGSGTDHPRLHNPDYD
ncbi:MAG: amidohydrolase, partial [Deltaproteobacteria bacterium]